MLMDSDAVPVGSSEDPLRAVLGSEEVMDSERGETLVNVALGRNPGGLDLPAPPARSYANETVVRPTPIIHTDVAEARPNSLRYEVESEPRHINTNNHHKTNTFTLGSTDASSSSSRKVCNSSKS